MHSSACTHTPLEAAPSTNLLLVSMVYDCDACDLRPDWHQRGGQGVRSEAYDNRGHTRTRAHTHSLPCQRPQYGACLTTLESNHLHVPQVAAGTRPSPRGTVCACACSQWVRQRLQKRCRYTINHIGCTQRQCDAPLSRRRHGQQRQPQRWEQ